ncbi:MAG: YeeE/YedE family protein [Gammaproteobacteria bacterium]|nr:YeeE/YedE family protein [Gammaproteobacteria bacterium]
MEAADWLIAGGLLVGGIYGVLAQRTRLCMVGGISSWQLVGDFRQVAAFTAAILVAVAGAQYLELSDTVAIADSSYRNSQLDWMGVLLGGLLFGAGATLAGGCATRTLVRTAEGNLQSLIALISFLIFAAITQFMFLEPVRLGLTAATAISLEADAGLATILGLPAWLVAIITVGVLAYVVYRMREKNIDTMLLMVGAVIGLLVVAGWYITGVLAQDEFDPRNPSAITVSGPLARLGYLMMTGKVPALSFAVSFVLATFLISLLSALVTKEFKITAVPQGMTLKAIIGGALMGIGGILAYGCNVGQGLTGISTLSLESIIAVVSMFAGTYYTVRWMENRA